MLDPQGILAHSCVDGPLAVVETLERWVRDVATPAEAKLEHHAAVVHMTAEGTHVSIGPRSYWREDLSDDDDREILALLNEPAPAGELVVLIGRDGSDDGHVTTLAELSRGAQLQAQAALAGLN